MNILLCIVLLILLVSIWDGYRKGLVKKIFSLVAMIVAAILSISCYGYISKAVCNNTQIEEKLKSNIDKTLEKNLKDEYQDKSSQSKIIENLPLPESVRNSIQENNNSEIYEALNISTFNDYVSSYLAMLIINAISMVITFFVVFIIFQIIIVLANIVTELPIINGINKIGGSIIGISEGVIIVWVLFIILTSMSGSELGEKLFKQINENQLLSFFYNNNLLLRFITNMSKTLF